MVSFLSRDTFNKLRPRPLIQNTVQHCVGINGLPLPVDGIVQASLTFPGNGDVYTGKFLISEKLFSPLECVLGWDFLTSNGLALTRERTGTYYLVGRHGKTLITPRDEAPTSLSPPRPLTDSVVSNSDVFSQCPSRSPVPITLVNSVCLPGRTEAFVLVHVPKSAKDQLGMIAPIQHDSLPSHLLVAYSVNQAVGRQVALRIMNTSNCDITLQAGQRIGEYCPLLDTLSSVDTQGTPLPNYAKAFSCQPANKVSLIEELKAVISPSLNDHDRQVILNTLLKYANVFDESLGYTDVITHTINTGNTDPIRQYPRRFPYAYRDEVNRQISDMLEQGVIQQSTSPWASPIVLVKKKDGNFRFCVDYRKLNAVTKRDAHPLPRIDDLLDSLQGSTMFSTLDLRSGYWQIAMSPEDREKTAFITPEGLWEFLRMPFGVSNGCATFQRAIQIVLSGLKYDTCLCYFDDIIIPSINLQQHCERLELVLGRFQQHNLRVKASKCCFGADRVTYLGHVVSSAGIHTDPHKIEAVSALAPPTNVQQVRSFLGLAGYYRNFIPNFAVLSAPLVQLTKKGSSFSWTDLQEQAFLQLKSLLCSAPILAYPQFDKRFFLQTDASDKGLGAVLTQLDNSGREHVISYASRSLLDREKCYSTTEKEALAIIFAIDHYRVYLLGREFTLITDHSALQWLHSVEPKGRLARWVMALQEFSFVVKHRPGTANQNADALSRMPLPTSSCPPVSSVPPISPLATYATTMTPGYNLQQAQQDDPYISTIMELKLADMPKFPYFVWAGTPSLRVFWHCWDDLYLVNGLLVKNLSANHSLPRYSFVIPGHLVQSVMQGLHCSPFSGHLGLKRTLLKAKERYFWPHMTTQLQDFVKNCQVCAQIKLDPNHIKAPLQSITVNEPFIFWAMDYMGPLPETTQGNKHLLVIMDHFTKWCEVFPTKDQKARTVAEILVSKVFSRFGPPTVIHSDQGRNFESNLMHEICCLMGVHKSRTSAYHPQCDGLVERQNRTLQDMLTSYVSKHQHDWDCWVDLVAYAYNTSTHASTGYSPYEMVFGRLARTPLELDLGLPLKNPCSQHEYAALIRRNLQSVADVARENLARSRQKYSQPGNVKNSNWTPLLPGQSVWLRRPKAWKFGGRWIGPYKIISHQGVNYKLRSKAGKDIVVHHNQVKSCTIPFNKGEPHCPVREAEEIELTTMPREEVPENQTGPLHRPPRLRQNINPPLRFGDFVTH